VAFNLDDYEPVASRLDRFLKAHPDARIITDLVHYSGDFAVFKAELWLDGEIIATGWEEEVRNSSHINKTSTLPMRKQVPSAERLQMPGYQAVTSLSAQAVRKWAKWSGCKAILKLQRTATLRAINSRT
jgi:hypothetical protein